MSDGPAASRLRGDAFAALNACLVADRRKYGAVAVAIEALSDRVRRLEAERDSIRAEEREACAKICDHVSQKTFHGLGAMECAVKIRERKGSED